MFKETEKVCNSLKCDRKCSLKFKKNVLIEVCYEITVYPSKLAVMKGYTLKKREGESFKKLKSTAAEFCDPAWFHGNSLKSYTLHWRISE